MINNISLHAIEPIKIFAEINQSEIYQIIFSVLNFVMAIIGTILSMVGRRWPKCVVKLEMF
ncbi:hypothetical protein T05_9827 [Trichinella murrelli]|uniref:Uncharacterized protein n=1 Tax=Trichinella murrelli TaxID=144512 RepID=A0A0V0TS61_9BILA|nr:hypothetical protein T05_9827 [Trichinella murrelli]